jgi:hypothetical protein
MNARVRSIATGAAVVGGVAAASYAALVASAWTRYGHAHAPSTFPDPLLDRFMPTYDVEERHTIRILAPPDIVFRNAYQMDLTRSAITRAIFKTRELTLGGAADRTPRPAGLVPLTMSLGWGVLAEVPDREIVMGAATQPWQPNPVFRPIAPDEFAAFNQPDHVKIVWTLRVEPLNDRESLFLTDTRATTTDANARAKFRRYWSLVSPGVVLIRRLSLGPLKAAAERAFRGDQNR